MQPQKTPFLPLILINYHSLLFNLSSSLILLIISCFHSEALLDFSLATIKGSLAHKLITPIKPRAESHVVGNVLLSLYLIYLIFNIL
jgi:hypothetical protein